MRMSSIESMATPTLPTSPCATGAVGVVAHLGRQVEGHREPAGAGGDQLVVALVGLLGGAEAGVLPHRPGATGVHRRIDAAGERILSGRAEPLRGVPAVERAGVVHGLERQAGLGEGAPCCPHGVRQRRSRVHRIDRRRDHQNTLRREASHHAPRERLSAAAPVSFAQTLLLDQGQHVASRIGERRRRQRPTVSGNTPVFVGAPPAIPSSARTRAPRCPRPAHRRSAVRDDREVQDRERG